MIGEAELYTYGEAAQIILARTADRLDEISDRARDQIIFGANPLWRALHKAAQHMARKIATDLAEPNALLAHIQLYEERSSNAKATQAQAPSAISQASQVAAIISQASLASAWQLTPGPPAF